MDIKEPYNDSKKQRLTDPLNQKQKKWDPNW
jgi:hypothetical protein